MLPEVPGALISHPLSSEQHKDVATGRLTNGNVRGHHEVLTPRGESSETSNGAVDCSRPAVYGMMNSATVRTFQFRSCDLDDHSKKHYGDIDDAAAKVVRQGSNC
jgi:hypothetical protein